MNLKNNPDLIAMYRRCHSQAEAWPEIREGIRSVGIRKAHPGEKNPPAGSRA